MLFHKIFKTEVGQLLFSKLDSYSILFVEKLGEVVVEVVWQLQTGIQNVGLNPKSWFCGQIGRFTFYGPQKMQKASHFAEKICSLQDRDDEIIFEKKSCATFFFQKCR